MPDLNHKFQAGRMNKDLDERLVPNGEYRDAMNVQVATSDGSDVGSLQNIMGNLDLSSGTINTGGTCDLYVVGSITDEKTDKLYWLVSGAGVDFIAEYDYKTGDVRPIVVDIFPIGTVPGNDNGRVLNFDKRYLITGINIIEDNLFWTDNNTEPKKINITRVRIGSIDFTTHTDFYVPNPDITSSIDYVSVGPIRHEHITVAKKAPKTAPKLEMKYTTRGDIDGDGIKGEVETMMTNQDISGFWDDTLSPPGYSTNAVSITFDDPADFKVGDLLVIEAMSTTGQIKKQSMVVSITGGNPSTGTCDVKIQSWDLSLDLSETSFIVKLKQNDPLFQFKFPRFAYRYKFANGEYSTFSPFSEVAFLPQQFDYLPKEGYNLGMVNAVRSLGVCDFVDERYIPDDVVSIDLLYKESNSPSVYSVKTIDRITPDPTGVFDEWNGISPTATYNTSATPPIQTYGYVNIESEMIHAMLPANQLLRSWDNIPRKALAQEVVANRLVYGNYLQNYNMESLHVQKPPALAYHQNNNQAILLPSNNITVDLKLALKSGSLGEEITEELDAGKAYSYRSIKTIKSLRTYQVGVVYIDEFGRETPVFSNAQRKKHTLYVGAENAPLPSKLKAQIFNSKPDWAKHFKFLIKETSNEYYNLALDRWYPAEDGNIWLSFPSSERNKVDLETFLILKKAHNSDEAIIDGAKYKILDIDNEAPLFLKTKRTPKGQILDRGTISIPPSDFGGPLNNGVGGTHPLTFPWPDTNKIEISKANPGALSVITRLIDEGTSDWQFRVVSSTAGASKWYDIKNISEDDPAWYKLTAKIPFGQDMSISSPDGIIGSYGLTIEFVKKEVVNKPEFDGRFFVKILKDARLQEYIIGYQLGAQTQYVVSNAIVSQYINPSSAAAAPGATFGNGNGNWFGYDKQWISLANKNEEESHNSGGGVFNDGGGDGEDYWKRAGQETPYTDTGDGQSSGWFIDRIEAFRPYKYTKHTFDVDNSIKTNPEKGMYWNLINYPGYDHPHPINQLQLIGNDTMFSQNQCGPNSYLGIPGVNSQGGVLRGATVANRGKIIPSIGIDPEYGGTGGGANLIHLSYAGMGDDEGTKGVMGLSDLKTFFGDWTAYDAKYVAEMHFIDTITTPNARWRWGEDPGKIVYQTISGLPGSFTSTSIPDITSAEWAAAQYDSIDNKPGTGLFNYTKLADYTRKHKEYVRYWSGTLIPPAPASWHTLGTLNKTAWVSNGIQNHNKDFSGFTWAGNLAAAAAWLAGASLNVSVFDEQTTTANSGGWSMLAHGATSSHGDFPMFIEDWSRPRSRRRRYSIHAQPLPDGNAGITGTEGLGGIGPHYYLPTNPPDNPPHYASDGTVLTNTTTLLDPTATPTTPPLPAITNTPSTIAPGIRPDGMYSGMQHPQLDVGSGTFYTVNGVNYDTIPTIRRYQDGHTVAADPVTPAPGSVTWQILDTYLEDGFDEGYFSKNPAIWETEPKEDVGLEIYHEVGQIYPTELNEKTLEQFFGPIHDDLSRNSKVTSWMPGVGGGWTTMQTDSGVTGDTDIRIAGADILNGEVVIVLRDITGDLLDLNAIILPSVGARLIFTRADGSVTEVSIKSLPASLFPFFVVESDVHNYEVTLPWFNAYLFGAGGVGNGVESNRIRDDYNQVTIDKGPKVSTVLEEPYTEERRSSGLIYSGIYNTTSGINNLNQFIQAEKITKDLNPSYGSIQKLFARNTNLVTFCEDKVFKILADKDALYNADGNINLTASENVLGQTIPFVGDYGISTNPESFASDSYRAYFADRTRGSILRLSQDGLTPISSVGMTDWFADNLSASNRIMGNFDDRKGEYNISLSYFDFSRNKVGIYGASKTGSPPYTPLAQLITTYEVASRLQEGDTLQGIGIPAGTTVVDIVNNGNGEWVIKMNQPPSTADVGPLGTPVGYGTISSGGLQGYCLWPTEISIAREDDPEPQTLSFSEINKGWVSFKSFHFEDGLSLNNDYFTFKGGQLFKHHANPLHNNFYETCLGEDAFTESSVEVLFNELPGSVKSFQTLNYEGSQSKITADIDNSGEYWDNKDKLGWYVDNMYTNLQEVEPSEFKDKEGKWFSTVKGVATEWLDDGTAGNIDTREFSYQGIDEAGALTGGDQYTSWDCAPVGGTMTCDASTGVIIVDTVPVLINGTIDISGNPADYTRPMVDWAIDNDPSALFKKYSFKINTNVGTTVYMQLEYATGMAGTSYSGQDVLDNLSGAGYNNVTTPIPSNLLLYYMASGGMEICDAESIVSGQYSCVEIAGSGGDYPTESACLADTTSECAGTCAVPNLVVPHPTDATFASGCVDGDGAVEVTLMGAATEWEVEYIDSGTNTVIYTDPNNFSNGTPYDYNGWSNLAVLPEGDYAAKVTDDLGCEVIAPFHVFCGTGTGCPSPNPHTISEQTQDVTLQYADGVYSCSHDGSIELQMTSLSGGAGWWTVEYFSVVAGVSTSIYVDPTTYYNNSITTPLEHLAEGDYEYVITDDLNCTYTTPFTIECVTPIPGCTDPLATNYDPLANVDDGSCLYPPTCDGNLVWDPNRNAWVSDPAASPFLNDIQLTIDNVVSDDCSQDTIAMISNASLEIKILSTVAGTSFYSYELVPGSNVDAFYSSILSTASIPAPTGPPNIHTHDFNLGDPSANGDWWIIIYDDLMNEECYPFTIACEEPPPCTPGSGLTNIATLSGHNTLQNNNFGNGIDNIDFTITFQDVHLQSCMLPSGMAGNWISGQNMTVTIYAVNNGVTIVDYDLVYNSTGSQYQTEINALCSGTQCGIFNVPTTTFTGAYSLTYNTEKFRGDWTIVLKDDLGNEICYDFTIPCVGSMNPWSEPNDCDGSADNYGNPGTGGDCTLLPAGATTAIPDQKFELSIAKTIYDWSPTAFQNFWGVWSPTSTSGWTIGQAPTELLCCGCMFTVGTSGTKWFKLSPNVGWNVVSNMQGIQDFTCMEYLDIRNQEDISSLDLRGQGMRFYQLYAWNCNILELWMPWNLNYPGSIGGGLNMQLGWTTSFISSNPGAQLVIHCAHPSPDPINPTTTDRIARVQYLINSNNPNTGVPWVDFNGLIPNYTLVP